MLAWKTNGTTPAFNSMAGTSLLVKRAEHMWVGLNNVDVECRLCIRVADLLRRGGSASRTMEADSAGVTVSARSRGFFEFYSVTLSTPVTLQSLRRELSVSFASKPGKKVRDV